MPPPHSYYGFSWITPVASLDLGVARCRSAQRDVSTEGRSDRQRKERSRHTRHFTLTRRPTYSLSTGARIVALPQHGHESYALGFAAIHFSQQSYFIQCEHGRKQTRRTRSSPPPSMNVSQQAGQRRLGSFGSSTPSACIVDTMERSTKQRSHSSSPSYSSSALWSAIYIQLSLAQAISYVPNQYERGEEVCCVCRVTVRDTFQIAVLDDPRMTDPNISSKDKAEMVQNAVARTPALQWSVEGEANEAKEVKSPKSGHYSSFTFNTNESWIIHPYSAIKT